MKTTATRAREKLILKISTDNATDIGKLNTLCMRCAFASIALTTAGEKHADIRIRMLAQDLDMAAELAAQIRDNLAMTEKSPVKPGSQNIRTRSGSGKFTRHDEPPGKMKGDTFNAGTRPMTAAERERAAEQQLKKGKKRGEEKPLAG